MRNPLWKDAALDGLFCPLDNICKFRIVGKMVEFTAIGTWKRKRTMLLLRYRTDDRAEFTHSTRILRHFSQALFSLP